MEKSEIRAPTGVAVAVGEEVTVGVGVGVLVAHNGQGVRVTVGEGEGVRVNVGTGVAVGALLPGGASGVTPTLRVQPFRNPRTVKIKTEKEATPPKSFQ
jgi:hypothetical protein